MTAKYKPKTLIRYGVVLVVIALVTTFIVTSTLNPLEVYKSGSVVGIIVISLTASSLVGLSFSLIIIIMLRHLLRASTGQDPDDVRCQACSNPLLAFAGSHGNLIQCRSCGKWYHNGPACYSKGLPRVVRSPLGTVCPECRDKQSAPEDELYRNLRSDLERLSK